MRKTDRQIDRQKEKKTGRKTERQTDKITQYLFVEEEKIALAEVGPSST